MGRRMGKTYNVQNLARWPKGVAPAWFYPGAPVLPEHRCSVPGCRRWRMVATGKCYGHSGRILSTVRQAVAKRRNREPVRQAAQQRAALARAMRALPDALRASPAWARALALDPATGGPRDAACLALALAWGNPDAWPRALDLLRAAERGEVVGSGGDTRGVLGGAGVA